MKPAQNSVCNIDEDMPGYYKCWGLNGENRALESVILPFLTVCCLPRRVVSAQVLFQCELR